MTDDSDNKRSNESSMISGSRTTVTTRRSRYWTRVNEHSIYFVSGSRVRRMNIAERERGRRRGEGERNNSRLDSTLRVLLCSCGHSALSNQFASTVCPLPRLTTYPPNHNTVPILSDSA
jgi:hypothetical protein